MIKLISRTACVACIGGLLAALAPVSANAVDVKKPAVKVEGPTPTDERAPTGSDCLKQAQVAAEKVKTAGGTEAEQQAAYGRAKVNCQSKM